MLNEIVARAVTAVSTPDDDAVGPLATRRRGIRSQRRLLELIEAGDGAAAEEHWRVAHGRGRARSCSARRPRPSSTSCTTTD